MKTKNEITIDGVVYVRKEVEKTAPEFVTVAGIDWCTENLGTDEDNPDGKLYKWDEAIAEADKAGVCVPKLSELAKLLEQTDKKWDDDRKGIVYTDKETGAKLFLPAAGYRSSSGATYNVGSNGVYWSSDQYSAANAYSLDFRSGYPAGYLDLNRKLLGFPVRCVLK